MEELSDLTVEKLRERVSELGLEVVEVDTENNLYEGAKEYVFKNETRGIR